MDIIDAQQESAHMRELFSDAQYVLRCLADRAVGTGHYELAILVSQFMWEASDYRTEHDI